MIKTVKYFSFLLPKTCDKYASCSFGETPWPTTKYSIFNETFFNVLNTLNKKMIETLWYRRFSNIFISELNVPDVGSWGRGCGGMLLLLLLLLLVAAAFLAMASAVGDMPPVSSSLAIVAAWNILFLFDHETIG